MLRLKSILPSLLLLALSAGCSDSQPQGKLFYDRTIQPILTQSCTKNTSGCHKADASGNALGNIDLSSFEMVQKRKDVLRTFGVYPEPLLLIKAAGPGAHQIPYLGTFLPSEIPHGGGPILSIDSTAYFELKKWLENGATRDGVPPKKVIPTGSGSCSTVTRPEVLAALPMNPPELDSFKSDVQPIIKACAAASCHGAPQSDFYLTCGDTDEQKLFNYAQARNMLEIPARLDQSEILIRPLDPAAGGMSHTGGVHWSSRSDTKYTTIRNWAMKAGQLTAPAQSPARMFFEANVMPILIKRGCAFEACHSPAAFNDFKLRPGSQGFLSPAAMQRNYELARDQFMAVDSADVRRSRLVAKPIVADIGGIAHRGGPALETPGKISDPAMCPQPFDPAVSSVFCTVVEWHRLERVEVAGRTSPLTAGSKLPLVYVQRPPDNDRLIDFDTFRGGADLRAMDMNVTATGGIDPASGSNDRSLIDGCPGVAADRSSSDVRGPEFSPDASKVIFAMRLGDAGGFNLYESVLGGACTQLTTDGGMMKNGVKIHNLDPLYAIMPDAKDGPINSVVFASTRDGTWGPRFPGPATNLYRFPIGQPDQVEQLTSLLGSELSPAFMSDGRITMTTEKYSKTAASEFYQLSGRRINWDRTDYHPLLAQRAKSKDKLSDPVAVTDSVGFEQATEIREGMDGNFIVVFSDASARGGGGTLGIFNRSVGPFQKGRSDAAFVKSVTFIDPAATGAAGPTTGAYRSPYEVPNGEILAAYAPVTDGAAPSFPYELVLVDRQSGARRPVKSVAGKSLPEVVLGYKRTTPRQPFLNTSSLVFGGHSNEPAADATHAVAYFTDAPMVATLLDSNLRHGRDLDFVKGATKIVFYRADPPSGQQSGTIVDNRTKLGEASLQSDGSAKLIAPALTPLYFDLIDGKGATVFSLSEQHQFGPKEFISLGVRRELFNATCAGCHGSISGREVDIEATPDVLTGASLSLAKGMDPVNLR